MAATPETSDYISIQRRINSAIKGEQPTELLLFVGNEHLNMPNGLMFSVKDYIELVEDIGRIIREDKHGAISAGNQNILNRLNIAPENWLKITTEFDGLFKGAVGGALPALTDIASIWTENDDKVQPTASAGSVHKQSRLNPTKPFST
jgi:hypothetical protein|tara:strand:+ start:8868 stop:9311 length:444 start_codon:yes stop_codon:yes gene_type:complete